MIIKSEIQSLIPHTIWVAAIIGIAYLVLSQTWSLILTVYLLISEFFFYNPKFLHAERKPKHTYSNKQYGFYIGAHRGGSQEGLENTIAAFKRADKIGSSFVEMDVCFSKDKKVVVIHDLDLHRLCGINKNVSDYDYKDLPRIQDKIEMHFCDDIFDATKCEDRRFPLFEEVCRELKGAKINMELKSDEDEMITEVHKVLSKYNMKQDTIWGSMKMGYAQKMQKHDPSIARFVCGLEITKVVVSYLLGCLPFVSLDFDTFQIPIFNKELESITRLEVKNPILVSIILAVTKFNTFIMGPMLTHLKMRGHEPMLWVINSEQGLDEALSYEGCTGIITDIPERVIKHSTK